MFFARSQSPVLKNKGISPPKKRAKNTQKWMVLKLWGRWQMRLVFFFCFEMTKKWMVFHGKPYLLMDDLGGISPYFLETPICVCVCHQLSKVSFPGFVFSQPRPRSETPQTAAPQGKHMGGQPKKTVVSLKEMGVSKGYNFSLKEYQLPSLKLTACRFTPESRPKPQQEKSSSNHPHSCKLTWP